MELSQETTQPAPDVPLADEVRTVLETVGPQELAALGAVDQYAEEHAEAIMQLLQDRGHYLPGMPPAAKILEDAKSFAEQLTLSNLALRILNMLAWSAVMNPESKPARRWIEDYIEGRNHGPVGRAMLWPAQLPGMAQLLRDWGFEPTPTIPAYVARSMPRLVVN